MKTRNIQIDALKYLFVVLVIFLHLLLIHGFINRGMDIIIDSTTRHLSMAFGAFAIPVFVFMSGTFCKKGLGLIEQFQKSFFLLKIFLLFQVTDLLIQYIVDGKLPSISTIFVPQFALWYLLSLFTWRIILCYISEGWNKVLILLLSVILSLCIGFVPHTKILAIQRTFSYLPFFMLGVCYGKPILKWIEKYVFEHRAIYFCIFLPLICALVYALTIPDIDWTRVCIKTYSSIDRMLLRLLTLFIGGIFVFCFLFFIYSIPEKYLQKITGPNFDSLFHYVYHPYVLAFTMWIFGMIFPQTNIFVSLGITFTSVILLLLLRQIKFLDKILHL